jgi:hypothetical protein
LVKQFKWFYELEEIMGDKPNVGRPICPVDSLGAQLDPSSGSGHNEKGKQKEREASQEFDLGLNEEEREELRIEEEKLRLRGNQPSPSAEDETRTGAPGPANFSPAGPSSDEDVQPTTRRGARQKNLRKLSKKAKARSTTKDNSTAVEAANEKMEALVKSNERIQKDKLQIEERMETKRIESRADREKEERELQQRMETKRIESHADREKEERELQHKNVQTIGGILKDIVHDIAQVFQPRNVTTPPRMSFTPTQPSTVPAAFNAPTPGPFSLGTAASESALPKESNFSDSEPNAKRDSPQSSFGEGALVRLALPLSPDFPLFLCLFVNESQRQ